MPDPLCRHYILEKTKIYDTLNLHSLILDIGCGAGFFASKFKNVVGLDLSIENLKCAHKLLPNQSFILADANQLPFKTGAFNHITSLEIIEHVSHPLKLFAEVHRCLKMNGYYLISVDTFSYTTNFIAAVAYRAMVEIDLWHKKTELSDFRNYIVIDYQKLSKFLTIDFVIVWQKLIRGFSINMLVCVSVIIEKVTRPKNLSQLSMGAQYPRLQTTFIKTYIKFIYPLIKLFAKVDAGKKDASCYVMLLKRRNKQSLDISHANK